MTKPYNIFDHLKDLTKYKKPWDSLDDERISSYKPFIINRCLSMNLMTLKYAEEASSLKNIDNEAHYNFLLNSIPKREYYFTFLKPSKDPNEEVLKYISKYFQVGKKEAEYKLKVIPKEYIQKIVKLYDRNLIV